MENKANISGCGPMETTERSAQEERERAVQDSECGSSLVGRYVGRDSSERSGRVLLGKVVSYDCSSGVFSIFYEDRHCEDLEDSEVRQILMVDEGGSNTKLRGRKRKLDKLVASGDSNRPNTRSRVNVLNVPSDSRPSSDLSEDADSSSDSCDYTRPLASFSSAEPQIVHLPPSSGNISVPEESISYLFSVYNFLRSFSLQLFLSPFEFDEFVGSLKCTVQNSLLDAIHVSLMRALRRHLQMLSSEGSQLASKCLRHHDWSLLDALTWPAIVVDYLYIMGYMKWLDDKRFGFSVCAGEYYGLPVATKLKVLQILCDDVLDSAEIRTELEMRENMEEENGYNITVSLSSESGPTRVHPRNSKTSACKNIEALESSVEPKRPNLDFKVSESHADALDAAQDGNSDECRLCGMDGTLICCDGCPSAYHSRCIGVSKASLPDGLWFCPECMVNKVGVTSSRIGRGTNGAEIFGIDSNGQVFLGTCNYLLVIRTSLNSESLIRYYNQNDVIKVLSALCSTAENVSAYADIWRGIAKYWEVPLVTVQSGKPEPMRDPLLDKEPAICHISPSITSPKRTTDISTNADGDNYVTDLVEGNPDNKAVIYQRDSWDEAKVNGSTFHLAAKDDFPDAQKCVTSSHDIYTYKATEAGDETSYLVKGEKIASESATVSGQKIPPCVHTKTSEQIGNESVVTDMSYLNQPLFAERFILSDSGTCGSGNENGICREDACSSSYSTKNESVSISYESKLGCPSNDEKYKIKSQGRLNIPFYFKPQAYVNQYIQGDVAASAAANLAVLASEETKISDAHASSNPKKTVAANIALQLKAFSGATFSFLWPSPEKKFEIPRERCGWCIACKGASSCKKGCLLNLAATNAIKRYARNLSGFRPIKHVDSRLLIIAAQISHMEESLRGLIVGPLADMEYNKQWHKFLREASSCRVLKILLLELERNIRGIAFSGGWIKPVDDYLVEFSSAISGTCHAGTSQKRGPGGRRGRKQSAASDFENDSSGDNWKNMLWWRGGKLSRVVFLKGALPISLLRKASRQGGIRRISGVHYPEGSELPRRSLQFAWRASVEMSKTVSQLALQVRYLDSHVRWRDLVRPDQSTLDSKGSDVDATVFRNAAICDKKAAENKIKYALTFEAQKHLPLRVTKNILESERTQNEIEKFWFSENHVPLYLIKEYEQKVGMKPLSCPMVLKSHSLPIFLKRQLKGRRDIFSYLIDKGEKLTKRSCASCQQCVFLRDAVSCSTCQEYCHKGCTILSTSVKGSDSLFTCKLCRRAKFTALVASSKQTLNTQLSLQGRNQQQAGAAKRMALVGYPNISQPVGRMEAQLKMRSSASGSNSENKDRHSGQSAVSGLIWKRKKGDTYNKDFRIENILLKSKDSSVPGRQLECYLCKQPYRSDLMYISCETCARWFHADALELEESQIFDLLGFKCGRCRRIRLPRCPYKVDIESANAERNQDAPSKVLESEHLTTLVSNSKVEDFVIVGNDPFLYSLGRVEPVVEQKVETEVQSGGARPVSISQQKLSVRRPQVKQENDAHAFQGVKQENGAHVFHGIENANTKCTESSKTLQNLLVDETLECRTDTMEGLATEETKLMSVSEDLASTQVEWGRSKASGYADGSLDNMEVDQTHDLETGVIAGDTEYEPQTYFSFTELLASEDGQMDDQYDMPLDNLENWSFDDLGVTNPDVPAFDSSGAYEMVSGNEFVIANEPAASQVACNKCKLSHPSPDLKCEICELCIHSHCSPWEESEDPSAPGTKWRCGNCREWR